MSHGGAWQKGNPGDLKFKSRRQLKSLKGLGTGPLSQEDKNLLGLTTAPREPVLLACARACARLISSGRVAKPEGKKEAQILIDAAANADARLGRQLNQVLKGKVTVQTIAPTRAKPRSAPFSDPVVQRIAEVMYDALSRINAKSVAENREYYLEIFLLVSSPPGSPLEDKIRNVMATPPKAGELATVPPAARARITALTGGKKVLAWGHTHGGPDPRFDIENFSSGDLAHSNTQRLHGGLGTPGGRFLFYNIKDQTEYDLTPMFGPLPT